MQADRAGRRGFMIFVVTAISSVVQWFPFSLCFGGFPTKMVLPKKGSLLALSAQSEPLSRWVLGAEPPGPRCLSMEG